MTIRRAHIPFRNIVGGLWDYGGFRVDIFQGPMYEQGNVRPGVLGWIAEIHDPQGAFFGRESDLESHAAAMADAKFRIDLHARLQQDGVDQDSMDQLIARIRSLMDEIVGWGEYPTVRRIGRQLAFNVGVEPRYQDAWNWWMNLPAPERLDALQEIVAHLQREKWERLATAAPSLTPNPQRLARRLM